MEITQRVSYLIIFQIEIHGLTQDCKDIKYCCKSIEQNNVRCMWSVSLKRVILTIPKTTKKQKKKQKTTTQKQNKTNETGLSP